MTHPVLGRQVAAPDSYAPEVLVAVPRALGRAALPLDPATPLPFAGWDVWTAYELAWRNLRGRPEVALATLHVPATSPNLVESKSLKLYLNALHATAFAGPEAVAEVVRTDVGAVVGAPIEVTLARPQDADAAPAELPGDCVDALDVAVDPAAPGPDAGLLQRADAVAAQGSAPAAPQRLTSRLLRTLCPVTGQPDWADVQVTLTGNHLRPESLLRYVASFARHTGFHEQCIEQIFCDVQAAAAPTSLEVYARYTRRGGIDINPWRSNVPGARRPANRRTPRQ